MLIDYSRLDGIVDYFKTEQADDLGRSGLLREDVEAWLPGGGFLSQLGDIIEGLSLELYDRSIGCQHERAGRLTAWFAAGSKLMRMAEITWDGQVSLHPQAV